MRRKHGQDKAAKKVQERAYLLLAGVVLSRVEGGHNQVVPVVKVPDLVLNRLMEVEKKHV